MRGIALSRLLMFVVLVPLAALVILLGRLTFEGWTSYSELGRASSVLRLAVATARFAGVATPAEAAITREIMAGTGDRAKLADQRRLTDELYRGVREAGAALSVKEPKLEEHLKALDEWMRKITAMRAEVDAGTMKTAGAMVAIVAPTAARAIDLVGSTATSISDATLSRQVFALYATLQFIESAMVQRGNGGAALKDGRLAPGDFAGLARGVGLNATFGKLFHDYAPPEIVAQYDAFDAANGRDLDELRRLALSAPGTPASEAQQQRWAALSRDITAVMGKLLTPSIETAAAKGDELLSDARRNIFIYLGISLAVLAAVILLSRQVIHILRELLGELAGAINMMRDGDYTVTIPHTARTDEIGMMARATEGFRENFVVVAERDNARKNAEATAERKSLLGKIAGDFEAVIGAIVGAVSSASGDLTATATALTKTAETTQQMSTTVAAASEEASTNVQSVASATEELVASVTEIGRQVQESSRISTEAVDQAKKTDDRITKLAQAASRIGDVTQLITSIAEQTNLLALNATIEAARAGMAGKGFAVVASEVKQLAAQTAKATSEISAQIAEMQSATQESVTAIKEIGGTIGRISEIATTIASAVEEQGAATQEITRNVQQAAAGTNEVASSITNVSRGAAETGTASAAVLISAKSLGDQSGRLKVEVDKFLATVRAA